MGPARAVDTVEADHPDRPMLSHRLTASRRAACGLVLAALGAPAASAQTEPAPADPAFHGGFVAGFAGSLLFPHGGFRQEVGSGHGGGRAFVGLQASPGLAFGLDLSGHTLGEREEVVRLESGLNLEVATTTDVVRLGLFARYGPRVGRAYVYVEGVVGAGVVSTRSRVGRSSNENPGETQKESLAPAAGGGVGVEFELRPLPVAVHARALHVRGGAADYLFYDEEAQAFTSRSSGTTASSVSLGLTYNFFRSTQ